jgi:ABC-type branched-subunit amino acid transport system permease subunit
LHYLMRHMAERTLCLINGEQEIGRSLGFWIAATAVAIGLITLPRFVSAYALLNYSYILSVAFLALGLCLIWGFAGILSLGQAAFLGLGGYAYGIVGINLSQGGTTYLALMAGLLIPTLFAAVLGYVMFYARVKGVYVAIMMLVVTLLFETFLDQTAGPQWHIGIADLGGNNGLGRFSANIREPPSLSLGFGAWVLEFSGQSLSLYYLEVALLIIIYLGLRAVVNSRFGLVLAAIRENPERTEAFGYDIRALQLIVFCIGAFLAALSGVLYVSWGNFITPSIFGVTNNILPVIWVAVGGRKSLTASVVSAVALAWLSQRLAMQGEYAFVVMGAFLIVAMMVLPEGIVTAFVRKSQKPRVATEEQNAAR